MVKSLFFLSYSTCAWLNVKWKIQCEIFSNKSTIILLKWLGSLLSGVILPSSNLLEAYKKRKKKVKEIRLIWLRIINALIQFYSTSLRSLNFSFCFVFSFFRYKFLSNDMKYGRVYTFPLFGIYSMRLSLLPSVLSHLTSYLAYFFLCATRP